MVLVAVLGAPEVAFGQGFVGAAGDAVVVYSEKAVTAGSRLQIVDRLAGSPP